ncbi:MAG: hypothetical protein U1E73_14190 [Planctomycetota bacterium]
MRNFATLFFPFSVASLLAQGVVPPLVDTVTNPWPGIASGPVPAGDVQQVHFVHLPTDPPNVFYCGVTSTSLSGTYGGVGGSDVLCGSYDVLTDTFTPNSHAAALNTSGTEFGLTIHSSGLLAVFDRLPGLPWLASRSALNAPWQIVAQISGLPSQSYYDPSLATYHGQLYLLHVYGTDIAMSPIDPVTAALTGPSVVIVHGATATSTANSPTPVTDPNGELIGVSHHDLVGGDNDHFMSLDLDPNTPAILMNDTTTWTNNGGFIGGSFFDAEYTPSPYHTIRIDTFWFTGGRARIGTTLYVRMFSPPTTGPEIYLSLYAASGAFLPAGLSIPGIQGLVGINPNGAFATSLVLHNNQNGEAVSSFNVPNSPGLTGARLPMQCATLEANSNTIHIGNTASLTID